MDIGERDPVTGQMTTGHEWNGIKELYTPIPRVVIFFLVVTTLFSICYWILMPAIPLGRTYTKGLLGLDQKTQVEQQLELASTERSVWTSKIESMDFAAIKADPALMTIVNEAGSTLFGDNCSVCHGTKGAGSKGFPNLTTGAWLWGGDPDTVFETVRVGINSTHPDTRVSQMLAFGRDGVLDRTQISDVVSYVRSLGGVETAEATSSESLARGKEVFADNCVACHGDDAKGKADVGAPNLTDAWWIYGSDRASIHATVVNGHQGQMPHWEDRLSITDRKMLTLYVLSLSESKI
ncbi:MAG TPA: cytochrome-c oxidase, cbb3-type subunit III [Pararhizobium sp.]|uniref:cytochrome-c oxidase, cbb3-type subunit III n=1 Tax=Pararhizobium sp. TaxID=1977563 RepID=UPI002C345B55|nr:cytochrome-c oxidase, cbb3-type subunit III [Pararhizobium sp.]HTO29869.1 cytochrome-c oxidase, cbb3-type subunit III [Pararhizobium sp.]